MTSASAPLRGPLRKRESHMWERQSEDWYVEPEWCSARLFEVETFRGHIHDPACGMGRIVTAAINAGYVGTGSDIVDRRNAGFTRDFLADETQTDNFASNPPFAIAEQFVAHALEFARSKVAMLLPANWVQGDKRSRWLATTPLRRVWFITPRPSMPPGHIVQAGKKPGNGTTDYAWFVWLQGYDGTPEIKWLRREP